MKHILLFSLIIPFLVSCQTSFEPEITTAEVEGHISYLASDELAGRYPGSAEDLLLDAYITDSYKKAGLKLFEKSGLQQFDIVTDIEAGPGNSIEFEGSTLDAETDFTPISFSGHGSVKTKLLFAGYGFQIEEEDLQWDDYEAADPSGLWVMIMRGVPGKQDASSPYINYSEDRGKALLASDLGAAGVILVSGENYNAKDELDKLKGKQHPLSIPVVQLSRSAAETLLAVAGIDSLTILNTKMASSDKSASEASEL